LRLSYEPTVEDHDLLLDINADSHHPPGEHFRILINSQSVPALSAWELRQTLTYDGHKTIRAIIRGSEQTDIQGHTGVFCMGTDNTQESTSVGIKPYGGGGYPTSYMGGYSRIHGDAYLTPPMFGTTSPPQVRIRDIYIDGDEAVIEFYNATVIARSINVYGAVHVK